MKALRVEIFPSGELGIAWQDGHESYYAGKPLRCACRCALCVDEMTGEKLLVDGSVAEGVRVVRAEPVGNYGLAISFSDGHATGIYDLKGLRAMCPCCSGSC